jgi:hypothetical protein
VAAKKGPMGGDMTMVSVTEDRLSMLQRMRARLAEQIDTCGDERALCLLMTRLQSVLGEIAELALAGEPSAVDEILKRRAERQRRGEPVSPSRAAARGGRSHG